MALLHVWSDAQRPPCGTWTVGQGFLEEVALCPGPEREKEALGSRKECSRQGSSTARAGGVVMSLSRQRVAGEAGDRQVLRGVTRGGCACGVGAHGLPSPQVTSTDWQELPASPSPRPSPGEALPAPPAPGRVQAPLEGRGAET